MTDSEITPEALQDATLCHSVPCVGCRMFFEAEGSMRPLGCIKRLARALAAEREERAKNPGVWDGAPDKANACDVRYFDTTEGEENRIGTSETYSREIDRSILDTIAEKWAEKAEHYAPSKLRGIIAAAITEYEELKEEKNV